MSDHEPGSSAARGAPSTAPMRAVVVWLGLCLLGVGVHTSDVLTGYELARSDLWHRLAGQRCQPDRVALVGIDELALGKRPEEPLVFWTPHLARAINVLGEVGAAAVGIDLLLTVSPEAWLSGAGLTSDEAARSFDQPFRAALGEGRTLLTAFATDVDGGEILLPNRDYWLSLPGMVADVALANLDYDDGGVVRAYRLTSGRGDDPRLFLGPALAARAGKQATDADSWTLGGRVLPVRRAAEPIAFCGPPGTVPHVSIDKLLAKDALKDAAVRMLKGRIVLLAATYHAAQDVHPTPYAPTLMHGAEVHAQIAEALLSGRRIASPPAWLLWSMLIVIAALASALLVRRPGIVRGGAYTIVGVLAVAAMSWAAWMADVDLPIGGMQATLIGAWVAGLALRLRGSERRRRELKRMFGRYVSDDVVDHLLRSEHAPDLGGEEREVTVLFSDIRNFTTLSERMDAHMVVEMLNEWFSRVNGPILDSGGTIDKYIGDAIMALFGAPVGHPDHARRALRAAAAMNEQAGLMRTWMKQRHPDLELPGFGIGVGLHSGRAVSGNIGSPQRMEFTTIGDTVNAASRIEGLTKAMGATVVISREVVDAAGVPLQLGEPEFNQVKGRAEPLEVMAFVGFADAGGEDA